MLLCFFSASLPPTPLPYQSTSLTKPPNAHAQALIVFHPNCPRGAATVPHFCITAFMVSCTGNKGDPVTGFPNAQNIREVVKHPVTREPIKCIGGITEVLTLNIFLAAMQLVIKNKHRVTGDYHEKCSACVTSYASQNTGCTDHPGTSHHKRSGNPTTSVEVGDMLSLIKKECNHVTRPACQLLPSEIRLIGDHCIHSNDKFKFGFYSLLLVACDLALRRIEYSSLHEANFKTDASVLRQDFHVDAFCLAVKTKRKMTGNGRSRVTCPTDNQASIRNLYLWGDDICGDIDAKRFLIAHLYSINWKGGYLYPTKKEIDKPPEDGIYKTYIKEDELTSILGKMVREVLDRHDKLTSHTCRKTFYLLSFMRGGHVIPIMIGANHADVKIAQKYFQDAEAIVRITNVLGDPNMAVGVFQSPHSEGRETGTVATHSIRRFQKPLKDIVLGFIEQVVGVEPSHPRRRHPIFLAEKIKKWKVASDDSFNLSQSLTFICKDRKEEIMQAVRLIERQAEARGRKNERGICHAKLSNQFNEWAATLAQHVNAKRSHHQIGNDQIGDDIIEVASQLTNGTAPAYAISLPPLSYTPMVSPEKKTKIDVRKGSLSIPYLEMQQQKTQQDMLNFLLHNYSDNHGDHDQNSRQWLMRMRPLHDCLTKHCNGCSAQFLKRHGAEGKGKNKKSTVFKVQDFKSVGKKEPVCFSNCEGCKSG